MWRGAISFGLVNIPVRLVLAIKMKEIRFHMLHAKDNSRLQRKMICPLERKEVPNEDIVKGFEIGKGQHVILNDDELKALAPKAHRSIEILYFVDLREIDPIFYNHPYYLVPEENAQKAYRLFFDAMKRTEKVAVGKFVMHNKEYAVIIRPLQNVLCLETMYFPDEVVPDRSYEIDTKTKASERELKTAESLIDSLSSKFEPERIHDDYREAVLDLVEKKAEGKQIEIQPEVKAPRTEVSDLLKTLEASLAKARRKGHPEMAGAGHNGGHPRHN